MCDYSTYATLSNPTCVGVRVFRVWVLSPTTNPCQNPIKNNPLNTAISNRIASPLLIYVHNHDYRRETLVFGAMFVFIEARFLLMFCITGQSYAFLK